METPNLEQLKRWANEECSCQEGERRCKRCAVTDNLVWLERRAKDYVEWAKWYFDDGNGK